MEALEDGEVPRVVRDDLVNTVVEERGSEEGVGEAPSPQLMALEKIQGKRGGRAVRCQALHVGAVQVATSDAERLAHRNWGLEAACVGDDVDPLVKDGGSDDERDTATELFLEKAVRPIVLGQGGDVGVDEDVRVDRAPHGASRSKTSS